MKLKSTAVRAPAVWGGFRRNFAVLASALALGAPGVCTAQVNAPGEEVTIPGAEISGWGQVSQVPGRFGRPPGAAPKLPAVLILHGSGGVDGRGAYYARALQEAGFATLEITMFKSGQRPREGTRATMPHVAAALKWLAARPDVDAQRLGVMGFSWGGLLSVVLSNDAVQERLGKDVPRPVAFAPFYPTCTIISNLSFKAPTSPYIGFQTRMRAAPMLIHIGTNDDYEVGERPCDAMVAAWPPEARALATVRNIEGATHGFDSQGTVVQFHDQFARGGSGGTVSVIPSPKDAFEARQAVVAFFLKTLKP